MVARPQMPHIPGVRRADPERHHHHGEHGRSWSPDRKTPRLFPGDISLVQRARLATPPASPSRKRKRCKSPHPDQLSKSTYSADGPRSPKLRAPVAERKPLADAQNLAIAVQTPLILKTSHTSLESPDYSPNMPYPPTHTQQLPPSFVAAASSPAAAAYATATSYRQCVQLYADKHYYVMYTNYHGAGPSHAQTWRAQVTLTQKLRTGHEVTVVDHTSTYWYTRQADAKEAASAEVWSMLLGRN